MPKRKFRKIPKYPDEARAAYGCATPTVEGKKTGVMMKPFDYTGKKLVSYKQWKALYKKELKRPKKLKSGPWFRYRNEAHPYKARFPDDWEQKILTLDGSILKKYGAVHKLVDHIIAEGNRIFANTNRKDTWMIYHDHLKILWEKDTIEYMKSLKCPIEGNPNRTWFNRFIKISGRDYLPRVAKSYWHTLVGDSPELMPLDCHLFADIKEGLDKS